jgi:hypothetical protein
MFKYSINITFENLGIYKEIEAESLEIANTIALELGAQKFADKIDLITYEVLEITDSGIIAEEENNGQ